MGEYVVLCGRVERMLDFLGIEVDDFIEALRTRPMDEDVLAWVQEHMQPRSAEEIDDFNREMATDEPREGSNWDWPRFREFLEECGQGHRRDIRRHYDRLDLDEGREIPQGERTDWWTSRLWRGSEEIELLNIGGATAFHSPLLDLSFSNGRSTMSRAT